tara:strand:- start:668 stop:775 length:108 start_codon:yes stop_codon:yes gene_type:complete
MKVSKRTIEKKKKISREKSWGREIKNELVNQLYVF